MGGIRGRRLVGLASLACVTACVGLSGVGDLVIDSAAMDGAVSDVAIDAVPVEQRDDSGAPLDDGSIGPLLKDVSVEVTDACGTVNCFDVPAGFSLVAYDATKRDACPDGYGSSSDVVAGPTIKSGACTCGCSMTTTPSCDGAVVAKQDTIGSGLCENTGLTFPPGCATTGFLGPFSAGVEHRFTPPAPSGGTCNASASKDAAKVAYASEGRVCQASVLPKCGDKVCPAVPPAGFALCVAHADDVACPADFPTKQVVGSSAGFSCGGGCSCNVSARGCTGHFNYYASADCSGTAGNSVVVNDTCVSSAHNGDSYGSHQYVPDAPTEAACNTNGSSAPSAPTLFDALTVCCR